MRRALLLALLALAPAAAQDDPETTTGLAMDAQIKLGDALRARGDVEGALQAYRRAVELYEGLEPETRRPVAPPRGAVEEAIERGLAWLARHQDVESDGKWDCDDFMKHDPPGDPCRGAGHALYDVGVTSLAVLAFLGAGYTDRGSAAQSPYAANVRMGLRYLMTSQGEDGFFGTRATAHSIYNHALATLVLCEAYGMTRNPRYKEPAQDGLNYLGLARNPYMAWRYEPRGGESDTSVTTLCIMALKSGKFAGLDVDPDAFEGARQWIDKMTDPVTGRTGYIHRGGVVARPEGLQDRFPPEKSEAMTAAGILTRIFCGENPHGSDMIRKGAALCLARLPVWNPADGSIDMYYWYFGTLAMFQVGGTHWGAWEKAMADALLRSQHPVEAGARSGSWDPIGPWGADGGRVYATAVLTMCLEVQQRYDRVRVLRGRAGSLAGPPAGPR